MDGLDEVVARLAEITDEMLALEPTDFARRFELEKERDGLRARAEEFHQRKDEGRATEDLLAELGARRTQLRAMENQMVSRLTQATAESANGPSHDGALSAAHGGTINAAAMRGMGAGEVHARIAELEQELQRRAADSG